MLNSEETLSQKFVRRGSWIFLFTLLTAPLGYIIRIILTGDLSKDEVGIIYGIIGLLTLFSVYNDLGFTESLNHFLPKYIVKKDYARCKYLLFFAFWVQMATSIVVGGAFYLSADWLASWHFKNILAKEVIQVMSLFFIGLNLMQISTILFSATQNTKFQKGGDFFRFLMTTIGILGLFFLGKGSLLTYSWAWIIGLFLAVIASAILSYRYYFLPYFSGVEMHRDLVMRRAFVRYSLATFLTANVGMLLHMLDQQILQNLTSTSEGATYAMYLSLVGVPFIFLAPIIGFLFPVTSELYSRDSTEKISTIHTHFSTTMAVLVVWMSAIFFIIGPQIAGLLYGPDYLASGVALMYIAPFLALNVLIGINFQIMAGVGMVRERAVILAKTLILNIILIFAMILGYQRGYLPFPSATSATAFAVGFAWILMWVLSYRTIKKYRGHMDWRWIASNIAIISVSLIIIEWSRATTLVPTFGLSGRLAYLPTIVIVLTVSLALFLIFNTKKMHQFWTITRSVQRETRTQKH